MEGHWGTNPPDQPAAWALVAWPDKAAQRNDWQVTIPGVLSLLATGSFSGQVIGLRVPTTGSVATAVCFPHHDRHRLCAVLLDGVDRLGSTHRPAAYRDRQ